MAVTPKSNGNRSTWLARKMQKEIRIVVYTKVGRGSVKHHKTKTKLYKNASCEQRCFMESLHLVEVPSFLLKGDGFDERLPYA